MRLIKLKNNHYIIVDDSEIKEGDWYYWEITKTIQIAKLDSLNRLPKNSDGSKKITHSTQPLELLTLSENGLSGMGFSKVRPLNIFNVKKLLGEVDVEKKAEKHAQKMWGEYVGDVFTHNDIITDKTLGENTIYDFKSGYNQALEDNKEKKYTEEYLGYLLNLLTYDDLAEDEKIESCIEYIKDLLQPKTEWDVEFIDGKLKLK